MSDITVVPERQHRYPEPDVIIYHLAKGAWSLAAEWQEIHCGAGIVFPHAAKVALEEVCPECKAAKFNKKSKAG